MAYATRAEFERWGLPPELCAFIDERNADAIAEALANASGEADTYLRAAYRLPLVGDVDPALRKWVCEIAAPDLLTWLGQNPSAPGEAALLERAAVARASLRRVAAKQQQLAVTESGAPVDGAVAVSRPPRGWGSARLCETRGWRR